MSPCLPCHPCHACHPCNPCHPCHPCQPVTHVTLSPMSTMSCRAPLSPMSPLSSMSPMSARSAAVSICLSSASSSFRSLFTYIQGQEMFLILLSTLLLIVLTKWGFERRAKFRILTNYGYNVREQQILIFSNFYSQQKPRCLRSTTYLGTFTRLPRTTLAQCSTGWRGDS